MGRTVTALVTCGGGYLGAVGPFAVDIAWWSEVEPVVAHLRRVLRVPVMVLRLVAVEGGEGGRDGHVTYHVEVTRPPAPGLLVHGSAGPAVLFQREELRVPWARADGLRELLGWASDELAATGRDVTGPVEQHKTWNLAGLFRFPTAAGLIWLKATPRFAADEATVITALARQDPSLAPRIVASGEHRILLEHLPGHDCWDPSPELIAGGVHRFVAAQAALADQPGRLPSTLRDRRTSAITDQIRRLLAGSLSAQLTAAEADMAHDLLARWNTLDECGLPDTLVHGDFHSGNWRSDGGPPTMVDFADSHLGNPVLDGLRVCEYLPAAKRAIAARTWVEAWTTHRPDSDPARALVVGEPLGHLAYAARYQEFLDGIEPAERVYHHDDPLTTIRHALHSATNPSTHLGTLPHAG